MRNCNSLPQMLAEYYRDELHDYHYYKELAKKVSDIDAKKIVQEFACDEYEHAQLLKDYYVHLTGTMPMVSPIIIEPIGNDLEEEFMGRVLPETSDMKKWKNLYLSTEDPVLRDIAFNNMNDEAQHATRLLYLAEEADVEKPK